MLVATPIQYTRDTFLGLLDHEVGTHLLRRLNHRALSSSTKLLARQQSHRVEEALATEEGLACLNQLVRLALRGGQALLYRPALMYVAAVYASRMSFSGLYAKIAPYCLDEEQCWRACVSVKTGGIEDSSRLESYGKPQVYFRGAVDILTQRHVIDFPALHSVKYSLAVCLSLQPFLQEQPLTFPPALLSNLEEYKRGLAVIAMENFM